MTVAEQDAELEAQIASWTEYLRRRRAVAGADVDELEGHLRDQVDDLTRRRLERGRGVLRCNQADRQSR